MGLCKCPRRKVTNQFCYEHCVNVCENCMLTNHSKCVIQSYLRWLKDSDCNPICTFCNETLSSGECCRLTCYHVFHWACLDLYCKNLPESQNLNSYLCPTCNTCIIPQPNLVSPVAELLRKKLSGVNWARYAQKLPLLSNDKEEKPEQADSVMEPENEQSSLYQNHVTSYATSRTSSMVTSSNSLSNNSHSTNQKLGPPYSVVNMESATSNPTVRRVFEAYEDPKDDSIDHDDFKYQRKSAVQWFLRWWELITRQHTQRRNHTSAFIRRYVILFIFIIGIFIVVSWLGRMATNDDPLFDLKKNPMVNIEEIN